MFQKPFFFPENKIFENLIVSALSYGKKGMGFFFGTEEVDNF